MEVVAVNIEPYYALKEWQAFWLDITDLPVTWAQDAQGRAVQAFELTALGTKIIVDRKGRIVYRSAGVAGYEVLRAAIEAAL